MGIQDEVRTIVNAQSAKHKRLVDYVARQLSAGRDLRVVLEDPYVTNRTAAVDRLAVLEEPQVVEAAGEEVLHHLRAELEAIARR